MTMNASGWRDGVTRRTWQDDQGRIITGGSFTGGPKKIVLHSTEGGSWPAYSDGRSAPHETWLWHPKGRVFEKRQHISHLLAARSLVNGPKPAQTNRDSAHQVELIGSSLQSWAREAGLTYLPELGDDFLVELGRELLELAHDVGCSTLVTPKWTVMPDSYGATAPQRFSVSHWDGFGGICGHEHVPDQNIHGDPGNLNVPRAITLASKGTTLTMSDVQKILDRLDRLPAHVWASSQVEVPNGSTWSAAHVLNWLMRNVKLSDDDVTKLAEAVAAQVTIAATADEIAAALIAQMSGGQ